MKLGIGQQWSTNSAIVPFDMKTTCNCQSTYIRFFLKLFKTFLFSFSFHRKIVARWYSFSEIATFHWRIKDHIECSRQLCIDPNRYFITINDKTRKYFDFNNETFFKNQVLLNIDIPQWIANQAYYNHSSYWYSMFPKYNKIDYVNKTECNESISILQRKQKLLS